MAPYHRILTSNYSKYAGMVTYSFAPPSITPPSVILCPPPTLPPSSPPSPLPSHPNVEPKHGLRITNFLLIAAAFIAATVLLCLTYYAVLRRRRRRPLRGAAIEVPGGGEDDGGASFGDGEPFHPLWYIRTVGLDESTIASIAVTEYRAGDGLLDGVCSCSVCLGEFSDGESVRLLPKCSHAFHVTCIDTWLRAHVNCPLCRAHIVEQDGAPAAAPAAAAASAITASGGSVDSDSATAAHTEVPQIGIQAPEEQERALESTFDIGFPTHTPEAFDSLPESSSSRGQSDPAYGLQPVRRSVSMDAPLMNFIIVRVDPEQRITDEDGKEAYSEEECATKGNSSKGVVDQKRHSEMERSLSSSGRGFFFSKHGRVARIRSLPM